MNHFKPLDCEITYNYNKDINNKKTAFPEHMRYQAFPEHVRHNCQESKKENKRGKTNKIL